MYRKYPRYKLLNDKYVCKIGKDRSTCSKQICDGCRHYINTSKFFENIRGDYE